MKKVAFVIYRAWAYEIFKNIVAFQKENPNFVIGALITSPKAEFKTDDIKDFKNIFIIENENDNDKMNLILSENKIDVVFYYGWSWFVKEPILSNFVCLCLHPSALPKYRGGSPIQNQIIAGETNSAISLFKMTEGVDDGDIYRQIPMDLSGDLNDIFHQMTVLGTQATKEFISDLIENKVVFVPQPNLENNPPLKRRSQKQSEVVLENASSMPFVLLYNMVRSLLDPYPNVFINFLNGKLTIQEIKQIENIPSERIILNEPLIKEFDSNISNIYLKLKDCYVQISKFNFQTNIPQ